MKTEPLLHTAEEAAVLLNIARTQVFELMDAEVLEWVNIQVKPTSRPRIRISHDAIERFIKRRTVPAKKAAA